MNRGHLRTHGGATGGFLGCVGGRIIIGYGACVNGGGIGATVLGAAAYPIGFIIGWLG